MKTAMSKDSERKMKKDQEVEEEKQGKRTSTDKKRGKSLLWGRMRRLRCVG